MSLRNKSQITVILLAVLLLSGCGFKPLYGQNPGNPQDATSSQLLSGIKIDSVSAPNREMGQQFKADLEDRLNPSGAVPASPNYRLAATLTSYTSAIGVARDGTISRYNVYLSSVYNLYRISDGQFMTSGSVTQVSSYNNVTNAYFSTHVAELDANKRGVTELAEMYRARLGAYLSENDGHPPVGKASDTAKKAVTLPLIQGLPATSNGEPITPQTPGFGPGYIYDENRH